jgi:osmotically-inducible protein OsmY
MSNRTHHDHPEHDVGSDFDAHRYGVERFRAPRSDHQIRDELCERLRTAFDGAALEVAVAGGVVTLTGRVGAEETAHRVGELAEAVVGVTAVHNRIDVTPDDDRQ